jgi:uncharacterized membrane protein affecting hemolysin expression
MAKTKLTIMIEDAENNIKALVEQYNQTVTQLEQIKQQASELSIKVLLAQEKYNTLIEMKGIVNETIYDSDGNLIAQSKII